MKRVFRVALIFCGLLLAGHGYAEPDGAVFQREFEAGLAVRPAARELVQTKRPAADFEYILVGGIVSDYLRRAGYFSVVADELTRQGVPAKQVHALFPPSSQTVQYNVDHFLRLRVEAIAAGTDRPIVFISHSKGAVETMQLLLEHPALRERTEAFFSVQGAFGGSPIADLLAGEAKTTERPTGIVNQTGLAILKTFNRFFHRIIRGVADLTISKSEARLRRWNEEFSREQWELASRIVFLRTKGELKDMDIRTRVGAAYLLSAGVLENDGALAVENQIVPGLPSPSVMISGIDHGLPCGDLLAHRNHFKAIAFVRALLLSLGH